MRLFLGIVGNIFGGEGDEETWERGLEALHKAGSWESMMKPARGACRRCSTIVDVCGVYIKAGQARLVKDRRKEEWWRAPPTVSQLRERR